MEIGDQLKSIMENRKVSREELSSLTGVSESVLEGIELNSIDIPVSELVKISTVLNVSFQVGDTSI
ncbi:helix-turn-helix domain-containing protein [Bacillus shivajii]|uniref:helix-turn-helix domain-containing protein n=1 Tax=Bacillus shivajii TaxID=1983719 RepID=UPI001CFB13D4|nr:helix-turn-helix transcriptional regulator [Bacillus shivajii]UCZ52770.1 helix-turn-helix domain-containing protein [Bacillus shivajii]